MIRLREVLAVYNLPLWVSEFLYRYPLIHYQWHSRTCNEIMQHTKHFMLYAPIRIETMIKNLLPPLPETFCRYLGNYDKLAVLKAVNMI
jgi:hypothetical protein